MLTQKRIKAYERDGHLLIPQVSPSKEVVCMNKILINLFEERRNNLDKVRSPEILRCVDLEPKLIKTQYVQDSLKIAKQLVGVDAYLRSDHAILKPPFTDIPTYWHQDEAYVKYMGLAERRASFWLPLQDVTLESGCMHFILGSHKEGLLKHRKITETSNGLMIDSVDPSRATACPMSAGDVSIHDCRTLHYAGPNTTSQSRLAWILIFAAGEKLPLSKTWHFFRNLRNFTAWR